jgi:hypothetical protein
MVSLSCCVFPLFLLVALTQGQFFDDYTTDTEYKGKFIGALNSYHHQVCVTYCNLQGFWYLEVECLKLVVCFNFSRGRQKSSYYQK